MKRSGHQKISGSFKQIGQGVIHLDDGTDIDDAKRKMKSEKEDGRRKQKTIRSKLVMKTR